MAQVENPSKKIRKYFKRARKNPISISVNGRRIKLMNNYFGRDWKSVKDVYRGFPVMALGTPLYAGSFCQCRNSRRYRTTHGVSPTPRLLDSNVDQAPSLGPSFTASWQSIRAS